MDTSKARFWTLQVPALQSPSRVTFKACQSVWDHTRARMAKTRPALQKTHRLGTITAGNTGRIGSCSLKISTEQDAGQMETLGTQCGCAAAGRHTTQALSVQAEGRESKCEG